jgi:hypothetical protein
MMFTNTIYVNYVYETVSSELARSTDIMCELNIWFTCLNKIPSKEVLKRYNSDHILIIYCLSLQLLKNCLVKYYIIVEKYIFINCFESLFRNYSFFKGIFSVNFFLLNSPWRNVYTFTNHVWTVTKGNWILTAVI